MFASPFHLYSHTDEQIKTAWRVFLKIQKINGNPEKQQTNKKKRTIYS